MLIHAGSVSFDTLTKAFGPSSLGIIVVKDLPSTFNDLRKKVLSNASYLAALPGPELGKSPTPGEPRHFSQLQQNSN